MSIGNTRWSGVGMVALALAGQAAAGEVHYGFKAGGGNLKVDADRTVVEDGVSANGLAVGFSLGYATDAGLLVELGILGTLNVDAEILSGQVQKSLGVGWQINGDNWRVTPKAGFLHSYLDSAGGRNLVEDGRPSERFTDTVPFIEAAVERRFGDHFGLGLFVRHVFEDFGDSQAWGIQVSWNH